MTTWFTSDLHMYHKSIMRWYSHRMLHDEVAMTEMIVDTINQYVQPNDTLYILGDIGWDTDRTLAALARINGRKLIVPGNHDKGLVKGRAGEELRRIATVLPQYVEIKINNQKICMCHFPIWEWNQMAHGAWHLHGHMHGTPTGIPGKIMDVSGDGNRMVPYSLDDVRAFMAARPIREHH